MVQEASINDHYMCVNHVAEQHKVWILISIFIIGMGCQHQPFPSAIGLKAVLQLSAASAISACSRRRAMACSIPEVEWSVGRRPYCLEPLRIPHFNTMKDPTKGRALAAFRGYDSLMWAHHKSLHTSQKPQWISKTSAKMR